MRKAEIETVKRYLTQRFSDFTQKFEKTKTRRGRSCVFAGTTNGSEYLRDATGGARFWCVKCGAIDVAGIERDRDQIWAEAVTYYREWLAAGRDFPLWWPTAEESALAAVEQERRYDADAIEADIASSLENGVQSYSLTSLRPVVGNAPAGRSGVAWGIPPRAESVSVGEILDHVLRDREKKPANQQRIGRVLRRLGWERRREGAGARAWRYWRPGK